MKNWISRIFRKNRNRPTPTPAGMGMPEISPTQAKAMLRMVGKTEELEISCDEVQRLLSEYAEMALRGEDTASLLPLVHHHLEMCPDCREEYEALMQILQSPPD